MEILNKQRLLRPSSPHFTIYQPQLTWYGSILNRTTGGALGACMFHYVRFSFFSCSLATTFSAVRVLHRLPCRTRVLRQRSCGRICRWTS